MKPQHFLALAFAQVLWGALQIGTPRLLKLDEIDIPKDARLP